VGLYRDEEKAYEAALLGTLGADEVIDTFDFEPLLACATWKTAFEALPKEPFGPAEFTLQASGEYYTVEVMEVNSAGPEPLQPALQKSQAAYSQWQDEQ